MSLEITEKQGKLEVINTANNLDKPLCDNLIEPLPNYSGFNWIIAAPSGSGKTTLLTSLMTQKSKKGESKKSYRKLFDRIIIISPTLGGSSMKKDEFKSIPEGQKFKEFNYETMRQVYDMCEENHENEEHTIVIMDDIGAQLRKSAAAEKLLVSFLQNRRHIWTSCFILVQKYRDLPTGIRNNMTHFCTFRPKNQLEIEAIMTELFPFKKTHWQQIIDYIFDNDDRFSFLFVDMSLKKTNKFRYFNKFNEMFIEEENKD
jgi:Cdc6-like AAA superfamily ATPase